MITVDRGFAVNDFVSISERLQGEREVDNIRMSLEALELKWMVDWGARPLQEMIGQCLSTITDSSEHSYFIRRRGRPSSRWRVLKRFRGTESAATDLFFQHVTEVRQGEIELIDSTSSRSLRYYSAPMARTRW